MVYSGIEEIRQGAHKRLRELVQVVQFFRHVQVFRVDVLWVEPLHPINDITSLLEQKLELLLLFCFTLFFSGNALLDQFEYDCAYL